MHHLEDKTLPPLHHHHHHSEDEKTPANSVVCLLCPLEECKTIIFKYHNGQHMLFLRNDTTIWIKFSWSFQTMLRLLFFPPPSLLQENKLPRKQRQSQMGNFCLPFSTAGNLKKHGKLFLCASIIRLGLLIDHGSLPGYTPMLSLRDSFMAFGHATLLFQLIKYGIAVVIKWHHVAVCSSLFPTTILVIKHCSNWYKEKEMQA